MSCESSNNQFDECKEIQARLNRHLCVNNKLIKEDWSWDVDSKPECVSLSSQNKIVYFYDNPFNVSQGSAGVRGKTGFVSGVHYFEIKINEPLYGTSVMFGFGTQQTRLLYDNFNYVNLIGNDQNSWGLSHKGILLHNSISKEYCEPFFEKDTVIGLLLNLNQNIIEYYLNGKYLGIAFRQIRTNNQPLYPMVSSTATDIELELQSSYTVLSSLQDACYNKIRSIYKKYDDLTLPKRMINYLNITS